MLELNYWLEKKHTLIWYRNMKAKDQTALVGFGKNVICILRKRGSPQRARRNLYLCVCVWGGGGGGGATVSISGRPIVPLLSSV